MFFWAGTLPHSPSLMLCHHQCACPPMRLRSADQTQQQVHRSDKKWHLPIENPEKDTHNDYFRQSVLFIPLITAHQPVGLIQFSVKSKPSPKAWRQTGRVVHAKWLDRRDAALPLCLRLSEPEPVWADLRVPGERSRQVLALWRKRDRPKNVSVWFFISLSWTTSFPGSPTVHQAKTGVV